MELYCVCLTILRVRLGQSKRPNNPEVGGALLCLSDLTQGLVGISVFCDIPLCNTVLFCNIYCYATVPFCNVLFCTKYSTVL